MTRLTIEPRSPRPLANTQTIMPMSGIHANVRYTAVVTGEFHWLSSDSKLPKFHKTFLNILVYFSSAVVWIVSIFLPIYTFLIHFCKLFGIDPRISIMIGISQFYDPKIFSNYWEIPVSWANCLHAEKDHPPKSV